MSNIKSIIKSKFAKECVVNSNMPSEPNNTIESTEVCIVARYKKANLQLQAVFNTTQSHFNPRPELISAGIGRIGDLFERILAALKTRSIHLN